MSDFTTIQLERAVLELLRELKKYPRQTYNELISEMAHSFKSAQEKKSQYDEFLHEIQKAKMKQLWDNKYDEAWENV